MCGVVVGRGKLMTRAKQCASCPQEGHQGSEMFVLSELSQHNTRLTALEFRISQIYEIQPYYDHHHPGQAEAQPQCPSPAARATGAISGGDDGIEPIHAIKEAVRELFDQFGLQKAGIGGLELEVQRLDRENKQLSQTGSTEKLELEVRRLDRENKRFSQTLARYDTGLGVLKSAVQKIDQKACKAKASNCTLASLQRGLACAARELAEVDARLTGTVSVQGEALAAQAERLHCLASTPPSGEPDSCVGGGGGVADFTSQLREDVIDAVLVAIKASTKLQQHRLSAVENLVVADAPVTLRLEQLSSKSPDSKSLKSLNLQHLCLYLAMKVNTVHSCVGELNGTVNKLRGSMAELSENTSSQLDAIIAQRDRIKQLVKHLASSSTC